MAISKAHMLGLLLAGGKATRFGGEPKGAALLNGRSLISHVAESLSESCAEIAISAPPRTAAAYEAMKLPFVFDDAALINLGPLAGILSGLEWARARGASMVLVAPCDAPFLTHDVWRTLIAKLPSQPLSAAIATSPSGMHPLCAVWKSELAPLLRAFLTRPSPKLAVRAFLETVTVEKVHFDTDSPFLNVNTPEDLQRAIGLAG